VSRACPFKKEGHQITDKDEEAVLQNVHQFVDEFEDGPLNAGVFLLQQKQNSEVERFHLVVIGNALVERH
jgi:GH25 family lysozyme M1 (1,4-beta-N-acetylmuramidase)